MSSVTINDMTAPFLRDLLTKQTRLVASGGSVIQANMRARAPKDTGYLINSVDTQTYQEGGIPTSETGPTAEYAEYVENGTARQKAQPYAEPAFQDFLSVKDQIAERILRE